MIERTAQYQAAITASARRIYIKAAVDISDPDLAWGNVEGSAQASWSNPEVLHDKDFEPSKYMSLEHNRWLLDGTFGTVPGGFALEALSGDDGAFATAQTVRQNISGVDVLQAFSVFFSSDAADGYPVDFTVRVLQGGTAYFSKQVSENTATSVSYDGFTVNNPDAIEIEITKWSLPCRHARLIEIVAGIYELWGSDMLAEFSATQQAAFSCLTLPYGILNLTMNNKSRRFEPRAKNGLFQSIEERQGVQAYIGVRLADGAVDYKPLGTFYQSGDGWKTGKNALSMSWALVDIIGLLADRTYILPDVLPTTLDGWIASVVAQLGKNFEGRYHVDPEYSGLSVVANKKADVSGKKCGDIIRWACMVTGCWPRADAETGHLTAEPLWNQGNTVELRALAEYPAMKANESVAALIFHLNDGNNTEYVISGNATSSEKTVTIENPFIHTTEQALSAARLILSCYGGNIIETTGRGDPAGEIGDADTIWLDESSATTARRMMQTFQMQNGVLQGCASRLLQADGSFLFQNCEILTEDGTWTAPDGVDELRIIVVGGGAGGSSGTDGNWNADGVDGIDGAGGKILAATIQVNPNQTFQITIGAGGAIGQSGTATKFGGYSSDTGTVYSPNYIDVANGNAYGRSGVELPIANSGDGGAKGIGGSQGKREKIKNEDGTTQWKIYTKPEKKTDGTPGASGCVVIWWDKPKT